MLALVQWGVRGLYGAPAIAHEAHPPTAGGEPPRAIKHPAVIGLDGLRAPVTVVSRRGARLSAHFSRMIIFLTPVRHVVQLAPLRESLISFLCHALELSSYDTFRN